MTRSGKLTPEQKVHRREHEASRRANWTPEQRAHEVAKDRERRERMTPEQRERFAANARARTARRRSAILPELPEPSERKRLRTSAGISFAEAARRMGVKSYEAVRNWEGGHGPRQHDHIRKYAAFLEELRATPTPMVDRAIEAFERSWEVVLAVHNGQGWTEEQKARLRRQSKNIQMSVYKSDVSEGASNG